MIGESSDFFHLLYNIQDLYINSLRFQWLWVLLLRCINIRTDPSSAVLRLSSFSTAMVGIVLGTVILVCLIVIGVLIYQLRRRPKHPPARSGVSGVSPPSAISTVELRNFQVLTCTKLKSIDALQFSASPLSSGVDLTVDVRLGQPLNRNRLHVISARCVARDLHTIALWPLERTSRRQFAAQ